VLGRRKKKRNKNDKRKRKKKDDDYDSDANFSACSDMCVSLYIKRLVFE
jgi:hypothetical protein